MIPTLTNDPSKTTVHVRPQPGGSNPTLIAELVTGALPAARGVAAPGGCAWRRDL